MNYLRDAIGWCQDAAEAIYRYCCDLQIAFKEALRTWKRQRWLRQRRKALQTDPTIPF